MSVLTLAPLGALSFLILSAFFFYAVKTSRDAEQTLPQLYASPEFNLTDCDGQPISGEDLIGKVWIVDFVFTRCGGPCPLMTQRMLLLQRALEERFPQDMSRIRLVSITVDPAYDTPAVLKEYAEVWGADLDTWHFLTGPPDETLGIIREGFKISASQEGSGSEDMPSMVHSTNFLLVDGAGFVRAIFHMDAEGFTDNILADVGRLLEEL
jgi:cytochrome oxidase Cu insertion factor (SCO1/SenC/PrrC family)